MGNALGGGRSDLRTAGDTRAASDGQTTDGQGADDRGDATGDPPHGAGPAAGPAWEAVWETGWEPPPDLRAAAHARAFTLRALRDRTADRGAIDDIVLMVDELITNAVLHGTGPVRLRLRLSGPLLTGEIHDAGAAAPAPPGPGPALTDWSEDGRGLLLVAALATDFGIRPEPPGKTVWFTRLLGGDHHPNGRR
ncbi:ATP-binding protein [Actinomadura kijaniata]|uniref:ATP-binding protein n=1 Tax=Actinomadura kijaniata TaxID=46161 RepID=UPI000A005C87|nr:ATP-binding protein [Actinomadura kijaniata]